MTIGFEHVPWVTTAERIAEITDLGNGFRRVVARFGFMEQPDVPSVIEVVIERLAQLNRRIQQ